VNASKCEAVHGRRFGHAPGVSFQDFQVLAGEHVVSESADDENLIVGSEAARFQAESHEHARPSLRCVISYFRIPHLALSDDCSLVAEIASGGTRRHVGANVFVDGGSDYLFRSVCAVPTTLTSLLFQPRHCGASLLIGIEAGVSGRLLRRSAWQPRCRPFVQPLATCHGQPGPCR